MRPEEKRANKLQYGKTRARLLLKKDMGWLPGFPVEVEAGVVRWRSWPWRQPGTIQIASLDRESLRVAEFTLNKLRHNFPRALPKIVEDVDNWLARMDGLLEMLKGAIQRQSPIDSGKLLAGSFVDARWAQRFHRLRAAHPALGPLLDAVAFLEHTDRKGCDMSLLAWIGANATALANLRKREQAALIMQLTFCTLREEIDANLLSFLFDAMSNISFCSTPDGKIQYDYLTRLSKEAEKAALGKDFEIPEKPTFETMGDMGENFLRQILEMKPKSRKQVTRLLGLLVPSDLVSRTQAVSLQANSDEARFLKLLRKTQFEPVPQIRKKAKRKEVKELLKFQLDQEIHQLLEHITFTLKHIPIIADNEKHLQAWIGFFDSLPAVKQSVRLMLFAEWQELISRYNPRIYRRFHRILWELSQLFTRRGIHERLLRYGLTEALGDLLRHHTNTNMIYRQWAQLLESTLYDRNLPLGEGLFHSLDKFVLAVTDINRASQLVAALTAFEDDWYDENNIRVAFDMASEESNVAAILNKLENDYELGKLCGLLGQNLKDKRLRVIAERWLLRDHKKSLLQLGLCARTIAQLGISAPTIPQTESSADWVTRYPNGLRAPLEELQHITTDAEVIADQILRKDFPAHDGLKREAETIRRKLEETNTKQDAQLRERLQKRLDNLKYHLDQAPQVTPQRIENLARKFRDRADYEIVQSYIRDCHALIEQALQERYGIEPLSAKQLLKTPNDKLLSGILQLSAAMRELGLRLLFKSIDDPTCDFRTEPQNVTFLETLRQKNIHLEPWLDRSFQQTEAAANGEPYRLFFASRIDDILLMGLRFDTCLSPDEDNFFSTIANTIDINKQVVYGKTESGRVIGRCLFALADNGTIHTYHCYAHDPKDGFKEQIEQFAQRLAHAMNTILASSGNIPTLVARKWYDDGAVSLESLYSLENADGKVRTILKSEQESKITERLISVLGSEAALNSLLGPLLSLEEFQQHREIVGPFIDLYAFDTTVPAHIRLRLAVLAGLAGDDETARQIVRSLGVNFLPRLLKRHDLYYHQSFNEIGSYLDVYSLLIFCNPSIALRTLRLTRPSHVKSDVDETDSHRKEILARCYEALGHSVPVSNYRVCGCKERVIYE